MTSPKARLSSFRKLSLEAINEALDRSSVLVKPSTYKHCCDIMAEAVSEKRIPLRFFENIREYGILASNGGESHFVISCCPWCGTKLPETLRHRWFDELEALGIDDPLCEDTDKIPQDFITGHWYQSPGFKHQD